ncbi:hypothetical protein GCM10020221_05820 [Streptomyces thioluteus]|uniref:Uncharacterized protein n=1 Tax=Streptomyces thioluteus TaxID=66431 RepID=A0ABP6IXD2_STRTU
MGGAGPGGVAAADGEGDVPAVGPGVVHGDGHRAALHGPGQVLGGRADAEGDAPGGGPLGGQRHAAGLGGAVRGEEGAGALGGGQRGEDGESGEDEGADGSVEGSCAHGCPFISNCDKRDI